LMHKRDLPLGLMVPTGVYANLQSERSRLSVVMAHLGVILARSFYLG
jgi:hypothetical protein